MSTTTNPLTSAWITLIFFFGVFCSLVGGSGWLGWRYYHTATVPVPGALVRSHVNSGVVMQARGQLAPLSIERLPNDRDPCPESQDICVPINEGERVRTRREAGYGSVASLVLPDTTHIQLWASPSGADLQLDRYQVTRWNRARQEVVLTQHEGYVRYDLASNQPYQQINYTVQIDAATRIELNTNGSYSIYVPSRTDFDRRQPMTNDGNPMLVEVATRKGYATLVRGDARTAIQPGKKVQVGILGGVSEPLPAEWELIADSGFADHLEQNDYVEGSETWLRYWNENAPGLTSSEKNARLNIVQACRPETPDLCSADQQVYIAQFRRDGGQTKPYTIGLQQTLDVDVSEYTSLRLRGWVRVLQQSVPGPGAQGSECPIMIQLIYKPVSPTDQEQPRYICVYTTDDQVAEIPDLEVIRYRPVPPYTWYQIDIELRDDTLIKQARYIQMIRIEARGHDYLAEVTGFSLVGHQ
jgi:hypothetical protein